MKNILITVSILFCFFISYAQSTSVTVVCVSGSACFNPEPQVNTSYTFTAANPPSGFSISNIVWTPTGGTQTNVDGTNLLNGEILQILQSKESK
jgi:hypothetical protein